MTTVKSKDVGLYVVQVNLHGRLRVENPEYGIDADTGGQTKYVHSLCSSLGRHGKIWRCDVLTRQIIDPMVDSSYAQPLEKFGGCARIIRLPCGPNEYVNKELLWPFLSEYIDRALNFLRTQERLPDVIHGHYADGGLVATRVAKVLGVPLFFTGHSLGRQKRQRLLAEGMTLREANARFNFRDRIEAEEEALENADLVIASTYDEITDQYAGYDHYDPNAMRVIAPGCDLHETSAVDKEEGLTELTEVESQFLRHPERPPLIMIARPDPQKNIDAAIRAFAESELRNMANLYLLIGQRPSMLSAAGDTAAQFEKILKSIDHYNLYGSVAFPRKHSRSLVAALLSRAAQGGGLLLAPSQHETFGLTLIEAGAFGVPVVSSGVGGMREIIDCCKHGLVADPSTPDFARAALSLLRSQKAWKKLSKNGIHKTLNHYSWSAHTRKIISEIEQRRRLQTPSIRRLSDISFLRRAKQLIITDIDDTLTGDRESLARFSRQIGQLSETAFGIATGRNLDGALGVLKAASIPLPSIFITSVGTRIHYGSEQQREDLAWTRHINAHWCPDHVRECLNSVPWLNLQPASVQTEHKISYVAEGKGPSVAAQIKRLLRKRLIRARVVVSKSHLVDVLPVRASKGHALRFASWRLGIPLTQIFTAGDSGNDADMLRGLPNGIVVANHTSELRGLRNSINTYFSPFSRAKGVLDGLTHFGLSGPVS